MASQAPPAGTGQLHMQLMASLEDIADKLNNTVSPQKLTINEKKLLLLLHFQEEKLGAVSINLQAIEGQGQVTCTEFSEQVSQLEAANNKLKYRVLHLKKVFNSL